MLVDPLTCFAIDARELVQLDEDDTAIDSDLESSLGHPVDDGLVDEE